MSSQMLSARPCVGPGFALGWRVILALAVGAFLTAADAGARQAAIMAGGPQAGEIGQAWLMSSATRCLLVAPRHVLIDEQGSVFLAENARGAFGAARFAVDLGDDVAAAIAADRPVSDCGMPAGSIARDIARHLSGSGLGSLRYVNGDGSIGRTPVSVIDDDGALLVRVSSTDPKLPLRKGLSGSLLYVSDVPVAMLLSVSARSGVGTALRSDALLNKVDQHLRKTSVASNSEMADDAFASSTGLWQVVAWRHAPDNPMVDPSALVDGDAATGWRGQLEEPITLELTRTASVGELSIIELAGKLEGADASSTRVQLLVSTDSARRRWRSVGTHRLSDAAPLLRVDLHAVRASSLRLELHSDLPAGSRGAVELQEIRISDRPAALRTLTR